MTPSILVTCTYVHFIPIQYRNDFLKISRDFKIKTAYAVYVYTNYSDINRRSPIIAIESDLSNARSDLVSKSTNIRLLADFSARIAILRKAFRNQILAPR